MLVFNGLMITTKSWDFMVPALFKNYQVLLLDMLDQGQTQATTFAYTQADQVDLITTFLDF